LAILHSPKVQQRSSDVLRVGASLKGDAGKEVLTPFPGDQIHQCPPRARSMLAGFLCFSLGGSNS
jgi:hypothetical protein